jgi:hypothetical protein
MKNLMEWPKGTEINSRPKGKQEIKLPQPTDLKDFSRQAIKQARLAARAEIENTASADDGQESYHQRDAQRKEFVATAKENKKTYRKKIVRPTKKPLKIDIDQGRKIKQSW